MSEGGEEDNQRAYILTHYLLRNKNGFFLEIIRETEFVITVACQACNTVKIRLENK